MVDELAILGKKLDPEDITDVVLNGLDVTPVIGITQLSFRVLCVDLAIWESKSSSRDILVDAEFRPYSTSRKARLDE